MKVLIVEDDPSNLRLLAALCRREECEVAEAENGAIGVSLFIEALRQGSAFDLVILDLALPVMDGREAAIAMRAAEQDAGVARPVHIEGYTSYPEYVAVIEPFKRAGINHLTSSKNRSPEDWRELLHSLIERKTYGAGQKG